jgi:hypothetical protein
VWSFFVAGMLPCDRYSIDNRQADCIDASQSACRFQAHLVYSKLAKKEIPKIEYFFVRMNEYF